MNIKEIVNQYKRFMTVREISSEEDIPTEEILATCKKGGDDNGKEKDG